MHDTSKRLLKILGLLLIVACWGVVFFALWSVPDQNQWDLRSYDNASHALELGLDPYVKANLVIASGGLRPNPLPFVYPLSALYVLRPITSLGFPTASRVWLAIKLVVLVGLLLVWKRVFLRELGWLWLLAVTLFAFQAATAWDIRSGNVGSIEQLFLWSGFACLVGRRLLAFTVFVTAAAFFKFTLAAFLLLLLLPAVWRRRNLVLIAGSLVTLVAIVAFSFRDHPDYFREFLRVAAMTPGDLRFNPNAYGLAVDLARTYPATIGVSRMIPWAIWAVWSVALLYAGRRLIAHAWRTPSLAVAVMVSCFCYALVVPRFMIYSYMLLIVPVLALALPAARRFGGGAYALLGLVCVGGLHMLPGNAGRILDACEPLLAMLACWTVLIIAGPPPEKSPAPAEHRSSDRPISVQENPR